MTEHQFGTLRRQDPFVNVNVHVDGIGFMQLPALMAYVDTAR
jgi:hypothetical protein